MSKTLLPIGIIILLGLLNLLGQWSGLYKVYHGFQIILWMVGAFCLGLSMNDRKKRSNAWVLKLIIAFVMALLLGYQLGFVNIKLLNDFFKMIGFNDYLLLFVYCWCGWAFFRD